MHATLTLDVGTWMQFSFLALCLILATKVVVIGGFLLFGLSRSPLEGLVVAGGLMMKMVARVIVSLIVGAILSAIVVAAGFGLMALAIASIVIGLIGSFII